MSKALIVYAHPNPNSFNRAILDTVIAELKKRNAEVRVNDLYAKNFNPVLSGSDLEQLLAGKTPPDIAAEQADISWADTLIFIYPIWWLAQPAILKGWVDRVFSHGFAYRLTESGIEGLLKGKKAVVITTSGSDQNTWDETGAQQAFARTFLAGTLNFSGIEVVTHKNLFAVPYVSDSERRAYLEEVKKLMAGW